MSTRQVFGAPHTKGSVRAVETRANVLLDIMTAPSPRVVQAEINGLSPLPELTIKHMTGEIVRDKWLEAERPNIYDLIQYKVVSLFTLAAQKITGRSCSYFMNFCGSAS
jgi:hypothetical protein